MLVKRADAYVNGPAFPKSIAGDSGHTKLLKVAVALVRGFGLTQAEAWPIFEKYNADKASPPESDSQLQHKLDDAERTTFNTEA